MAKSLVTASPISLSGVEAVKQVLSNNRMFNADDWNAYLAQGRINEYVQTLTDFENKIDYDKFDIGLGGIKYLTSDQRMAAMQNELYGNKEDKIKKKRTVIMNEGTNAEKEIEQEYETTEYDYVKNLLKNQVAYNKILKYNEDKDRLQASRDIAGNIAKSIPHGVTNAFIKFFGDISNVFEGIGRVGSLITTEGMNTYGRNADGTTPDNAMIAMGNAFKSALTETGWDDKTIDWLQQNLWMYEEGDYDGTLARYTYSAADSFGRMIPGMIMGGLSNIPGFIGEAAAGLAKTSQVIFYGAMASGNMKELFRDPTMTTRPTFELMVNATAKAAAEYGVEALLGKAFGASTIDSMAFGYGAKSSSAITAKNALMRIGKDAFQEGSEEVLQDLSGYLIDRIFSIWAQDYANCSDWTIQGVFDAFVLGAAMSFGGNLLKIATTKKVSLGDVDEKGKFKKLNKFASFEYYMTLQDVFEQLDNVDFNSMSQDEQASIVGGAFTTLRTITSLYDTFGEERLAVAQDMLKSVMENANINVGVDMNSEVRNTVNKLVAELQLGKKNFNIIEEQIKLNNVQQIEQIVKGAERKSIEQIKQELIEQKMSGIVTEIKNTDTADEVKEKLDVDDDVANTLLRIMEGTGKESTLVTENGIGIVEAGNTLIIAKQCATDFDADTNMRTLSEQRIISAVLTDNELAGAFDKVRNSMIAPNGKPYTQAQFMTMLLYDNTFAYNILFNGDKALVNLISRLDYIAKFVVKDRKIGDISANDYQLIIDRLHAVLFNYYKGAAYVNVADIDQSTILTKEEKQQLRAHNWQKGIYGKVIERNELPSKEDLKVLEIMTNSMKVDEDTKKQMLADLNSGKIATVKTAFKKIVTEFETNFKGSFNNHIYLEYNGNPLNAEFNTFLISHNITIDQILDGNVSPELAQQIAKAYGSVSPTDVVKFFQDQYKAEYRHDFTPDFVERTIKVKEGTAKVYGNKTWMQDITDIEADSSYNAKTMLVKKSYDLPYNKIFSNDLTKYQRTNATIDDVIKDPRMQSAEVKTMTKSKYGDNSPMHTFMYLRDYILNKSSGIETILVDNNGNYYIASIEGSEKVSTVNLQRDSDFAKTNDVLTKVSDDPIDGVEDLDITNYISKKYLSVFGKNNVPKLVVESMTYTEGNTTVIDRNTYGYYDEVSNTIVINGNVFGNSLSENRKLFNWTLLHEFRHALQAANGLTLGFSEYLQSLEPKAAKPIIMDLRKHFPTVFSKDYDYKTDVKLANAILYRISGEADATGYMQELNVYPLAIERDSNGYVKKIITPWGTEYNKNGVIDQKVKSKSMRYERGVGYTMAVNNVMENEAKATEITKAITDTINDELNRNYTYKINIEASSKLEQDINNISYNDGFWKKIEQSTGLEFSEGARKNWNNYAIMSKSEKLVMKLFPNLSLIKARAEFFPTAVITATDPFGLKVSFVSTSLDDTNISSVVKQISKTSLYGKGKITVSVQNLSVGAFLSGSVWSRGDKTDIVRLMDGYISMPITDTVDITNTFDNKRVTLIGIDKIQDFSNKVLSTYDTNSTEKIGNTMDHLSDFEKDMREKILQNPDITLDEWKQNNTMTIATAKLAMRALYHRGVLNERLFDANFNQYLKDVFYLAHSDTLETYMWKSGNTSASDPRRIETKEALLTDIKQHPEMFNAMMRIAKFQIAPMLTYDEFMNMDIPFVRIVTQSQKDEGLFSGSSLGTVNLVTQLSLVHNLQTPYKLYIGTVKPKDTLGFTISGEYEVLLKDSTIAKAQEVTVALMHDAKFYLLGEEYGYIDKQIENINMTSEEGVPLDTRFSFLKGTGRPRYVSHESAQNSNLKYYVHTNEIIQIDPKLQDLNINSTGIESRLDSNFVKLIKQGRVRTKSDLYKYIERTWTLDNYIHSSKETRTKLEETFKLINDNYFNNTAIPNLKALLVLMEQGMDDYYAARSTILKYAEEHPDNAKLQELLTKTTNAASLQQVVNYIRDNAQLKEMYSDFKTAFSVYRGYQDINVDIGKKKMLVPMMSTFDGTLDTAGKIASNIRWTGILDIQQTHKAPTRMGKEGDQETDIEDSYADTGVNNVSGIVKTEDKAEWLINHFIDNDLDGKSWSSTKEYMDARRKLRSIYEAKVDDMSDAEIGQLYDNAVYGDETARIVKSQTMIDEVVTNKKNLTVRGTYNQARNIANNIIRKLTVQQLKEFVKNHPDLGISENGTYKYPLQQKVAPTMELEGKKNILLARRDYNAKLQEAYKEVLDGKYGSKAEQKIIAQQQKRITKLERDLAAAMNVKSTKSDDVQLIVEGDGKITANTDANIPEVLQKVFDTEFNTTAKTEVKYLSDENDYHFKRNYETFVDQNAEHLTLLTETDIDNILDFYERYSLAPNTELGETYTKFMAIRQYMLMYIYKLGSESLIPLSPENTKRIEGMFKTIKSTAGTELSISREAQEIINPTEVIIKSLQKVYGVDVDDNDIDALRMVVKRDYTTQAKAAGIGVEEYRVQELNKVLKRIEQSTAAQLKGRPRSKVDQILKWQRMAMLSSVGTWARNAVSNVMLDVTNKASDTIGDAVFGVLDKVTKNNNKRKLPDDQYKITGTKLNKADANDKVLIDWIDNTVRASGIMDLVADGITKYDAGLSAHKSAAPSEIVAQLIVNNTMSKLSNQTTFPDGNHWWSKPFMKAGNTMAKFLYGYVDSNGDYHNGMITDTKAVTKSFYSYLGKMIKEDMIAGRITTNDLDQGLNNRKMLDIISNAYVMASYDYMHKPNFFNKLDGLIRKYTGDGGYFIWKQFEPFAAAGWNWFKKGLEYTPIGLAKSIVNYVKLENYINKMEKARTEVVSPSERFGTYLVKRGIGSGIIGTIGTIAGGLLVGLGVAGIDDDDGKPKLYVGDISVDISNVFGTSGILAGIAIGGAFVQAKTKNQSWFEAVVEGFVSSFDVMFEDSVFSDLFDIMQSRETFGQVCMNRLGSIAGMFMPNILKSAMSYTTVVTPKYSSGILGQLERQVVQVLPSLAYALPRRYDIYTGETQFKYNMPWMDRWFDAVMGSIANFASPIKIKRRATSELETLATSLGVSKGELTGRYSDIGTLSAENVSKLNGYYGQLNNTELTKFVKGQEKYYVENEKGKRVQLYYNQMTDKQKKSVITRIMSDNAKYAKVYVGTQMGYKYYANEDDYKKLIQLGVSNVYHNSKKYNGFVK